MLFLRPTFPFLAVTLPHRVKLRSPAFACLRGSEWDKIAYTSIGNQQNLQCRALSGHTPAVGDTGSNDSADQGNTFCSKGKTTPLEPRASRLRVRCGCATIVTRAYAPCTNKYEPCCPECKATQIEEEGQGEDT